MNGLSKKARAFFVDAILGIQQEEADVKADDSVERSLNLIKAFSNEDHISLIKTTIKAELCCKDLWKEFDSLGTEMIITKAGRRRMFPTIKLRLSGINENVNYMIFMDIIPLDDKRYRYIYHSSQWISAGNGDSSNSRIYIHPDSPANGQLWMTQGGLITFDKLKLTNNQDPVINGQISLHSMHKYIPRIHIIPNWNNSEIIKPHHLTESVIFTFPETSFITVTAYQNQQITKLKIACNPFAKGFREAAREHRPYKEEEFDRIVKKELKSSTSILQHFNKQSSDKMNNIFTRTAVIKTL